MLYRNVKTGATINTKSILGGVWEPEKASQTKPVETEETPVEKPKKRKKDE